MKFARSLGLRAGRNVVAELPEMFLLPSPALMKSLYAGGSAVRTLTFFSREGAQAALRGDCFKSQPTGRATGAAVTLLPRKDSVMSAGSSAGAPLRNFGGELPTASSKFPTYMQRHGGFTVASILKQSEAVALDESQPYDEEMDKFVDGAHKMADAAGAIIRQFFRTKVEILDKDDASPVTIADRRAEAAMSLLISEYFPTHGIYGEEGGLFMPEEKTEYVWVLDPIDGTKSFITGKPLFGTLIALVHKGLPILGIIDQPILGERWVGRAGRRSTLNGEPIAARSSTQALKDAYLYTTSPHFFAGSREAAFIRVRDKVKQALYGCDCYAYGLLAAGHTDLVVESGLKPYDWTALVPVIEGAGGYITDWEGKSLRFWPSSDYPSAGEGGIEVAAAGNAVLHKAALAALAGK